MEFSFNIQIVSSLMACLKSVSACPNAPDPSDRRQLCEKAVFWVAGVFDNPPGHPQWPSGVNVLEGEKLMCVVHSLSWFSQSRAVHFSNHQWHQLVCAVIEQLEDSGSRTESLKASEVEQALLCVSYISISWNVLWYGYAHCFFFYCSSVYGEKCIANY